MMRTQLSTLCFAMLLSTIAVACGDDTSGAADADGDASGDGFPDGSGDGQADGDVGDGSAGELDPQVPPAEPTQMAAWLAAWASNGWEAGWVCETSATAKTEGDSAIHVHNDADGKNRVCNNQRLAAATPGEAVPEGSAALKFVGDEIFVEVKTAADSAEGQSWYWYGAGGVPEGKGIEACRGCHSAAGSDAAHPGLGDFVYFQVASDDAAFDAQVPPADAAQMMAWLALWESQNWEAQWVCESEPTAKTDGAAAIHAHNDSEGKNRVCNNQRLAAATAGEPVPEGSAAVKFVDERIYVEVKTAPESNGGQNWFWYAPGGAPAGQGLAACIGCHGAAGNDADHPGLGDYVYFQVRSAAP